MPKLPIEHGDNGAIAREKINESWKQLLIDIEKMRPHIKDGYWRVGEKNTQILASGKKLQLRIHNTHIQYQSEEEQEWKDLIALETLKGEKGDPLTFSDLTPEQKSELKGEQGDQGVSITAITDKREGNGTKLTIHKSDRSFQEFDIRDGKNPEFQFSETHLQYRLSGEEERKNLIEKSAIKGGTIQSIERTSGNGGAGSVDVYTIRLSDGSSQEFSVYNGRDGTGAGDMKKAENLAGLSDMAQARENLGAEASSNKKTSIEDNKSSNSFFPTIKAVYDWVISKLGSKADLVGGKVSAEQLPEMQAIDESDLVHKSGDEEIGGKKSFSNDIETVGTDGEYWRGSSFTSKKSKTSPEMWKMGGRSDYGNGLLFEFYNGRYYNNFLMRRMGGFSFQYFIDDPNNKQTAILASRKDLSNIPHNQEGHILQFLWGDCGHNPEGSGTDGGRGLEFGTHQNPYLRMKGTRVEIGDKTLLVNGQDWTGEWQSYTPTLSGDGGSGATFSDQQGRYKVIGKTCFILVRGIIGNKGSCGGKFKVSIPVSSKSRTASPLSGALQWLGQNIAQAKGIPFVANDHIGINGISWGHRDIQWSEISVNDFFIFSGVYEVA